MPPPSSTTVINTSHYTCLFIWVLGIWSQVLTLVLSYLPIPGFLGGTSLIKNGTILPDRWHRTPYLQLSPSGLLENLSIGQHAHEVDFFYQGNHGDPLSMPKRQKKKKRGTIISPNFKTIHTHFCQNHICITWKWQCMQKICTFINYAT